MRNFQFISVSPKNKEQSKAVLEFCFDCADKFTLTYSRFPMLDVNRFAVKLLYPYYEYGFKTSKWFGYGMEENDPLRVKVYSVCDKTRQLAVENTESIFEPFAAYHKHGLLKDICFFKDGKMLFGTVSDRKLGALFLEDGEMKDIVSELAETKSLNDCDSIYPIFLPKRGENEALDISYVLGEYELLEKSENAKEVLKLCFDYADRFTMTYSQFPMLDVNRFAVKSLYPYYEYGFKTSKWFGYEMEENDPLRVKVYSVCDETRKLAIENTESIFEPFAANEQNQSIEDICFFRNGKLLFGTISHESVCVFYPPDENFKKRMFDLTGIEKWFENDEGIPIKLPEYDGLMSERI